MTTFEVPPLNPLLVKRFHIVACSQSANRRLFDWMLSYDDLTRWLGEQRQQQRRQAIQALVDTPDTLKLKAMIIEQQQLTQRTKVVTQLDQADAWPSERLAVKELSQQWSQQSRFADLKTLELLNMANSLLDEIYAHAVLAQDQIDRALQANSKHEYLVELQHYFYRLQQTVSQEQQLVVDELTRRLKNACDSADMRNDDALAAMLLQRHQLKISSDIGTGCPALLTLSADLLVAAYQYVFRHGSDVQRREVARLPWYQGRIGLSRQGKLYALPYLFEDWEIPKDSPSLAWLFRGTAIRYMFFRDGLRQIKLGLALRRAMQPVSTDLSTLITKLDAHQSAIQLLQGESKRTRRAELLLWPIIHNQTQTFLGRWQQDLQQKLESVMAHQHQQLLAVLEQPDLISQFLTTPRLLQTTLLHIARTQQQASYDSSKALSDLREQLKQRCLENIWVSLLRTDFASLKARQQWAALFARPGERLAAMESLLGKPTCRVMSEIIDIWQRPMSVSAKRIKKQIYSLSHAFAAKNLDKLWSGCVAQVIFRADTEENSHDREFLSTVDAAVQQVTTAPVSSEVATAVDTVLTAVAQQVAEPGLMPNMRVLKNQLRLLNHVGVFAVEARQQCHHALNKLIQQCQVWQDPDLDSILLECADPLLIRRYGLRKLSLAIAANQQAWVLQQPFFAQAIVIYPGLQADFSLPIEDYWLTELIELHAKQPALSGYLAWQQAMQASCGNRFPKTRAVKQRLAEFVNQQLGDEAWSISQLWLAEQFADQETQQQSYRRGLDVCLNPKRQIDAASLALLRERVIGAAQLGSLGIEEGDRLAVFNILRLRLSDATECAVIDPAQYHFISDLMVDRDFITLYQLESLKPKVDAYHQHARLLISWDRSLKALQAITADDSLESVCELMQGILQSMREHQQHPRYQNLVLRYQAQVAQILRDTVITRIKARLDQGDLCVLMQSLDDQLLSKLDVGGLTSLSSEIASLQLLVLQQSYLSTIGPRLLEAFNGEMSSPLSVAKLNGFSLAVLRYRLLPDRYWPVLVGAVGQLIEREHDKQRLEIWHAVQALCSAAIEAQPIQLLPACLQAHLEWVNARFEQQGDPLSPVPSDREVSNSMRQALCAFYELDGEAPEASVVDPAQVTAQPLQWLYARTQKALTEWIAELRWPDRAHKARMALQSLLPELQSKLGQDHLLDPKIEALMATAESLDSSLLDRVEVTSLETPQSAVTPLICQ